MKSLISLALGLAVILGGTTGFSASADALISCRVAKRITVAPKCSRQFVARCEQWLLCGPRRLHDRACVSYTCKPRW
jgi:hypothetical protein